MSTTFKPKIFHFLFSLADLSAKTALRLLKYCLICLVSIVFFGEFVENKMLLAQEEEAKKCIEFVKPKTIEELKELRNCLKKFNIESGADKRVKIIKRSYEGSLNLTAKINLSSDNKTSKKLPDNL